MKNDQAFPVPGFSDQNGYFTYSVEGLTKRELFAAMAMQGVITNRAITEQDLPAFSSGVVKLADALIAALEEK